MGEQWWGLGPMSIPSELGHLAVPINFLAWEGRWGRQDKQRGKRERERGSVKGNTHRPCVFRYFQRRLPTLCKKVKYFNENSPWILSKFIRRNWFEKPEIAFFVTVDIRYNGIRYIEIRYSRYSLYTDTLYRISVICRYVIADIRYIQIRYSG